MSRTYEANLKEITYDSEGGEVMVINLNTGLYFLMQGTAAQAWTWLLQGASVDQVVDGFHSSFDAERENIQAAVSHFLNDLERQRLVIPAQRELAAPLTFDTPATRREFVAPLLQAYRDAQNFVVARPITRATRLKPANVNVVGEIYPDEAVVLDMGRGLYFSLPGTASLIWEGINANATVEEIVEVLHQHFEISWSEIEDSVIRFMDELCRIELVRVVTDQDAGVAPFKPTTTLPDGAAGFTPPQFVSYSDMQNLLLLDPIHEVDEELGWPHPASD